MSKEYYIDPEYLPPKLPTSVALVWYLFLEHINAPSIWYGILGTLFAIVFIGNIYKLFQKSKRSVMWGKDE